MMYIQTPKDNGDKKLKRFGSLAVGFLKSIVTPKKGEKNVRVIIFYNPNSLRYVPKFMKGIVKSTPCSRSYVIVKSATAKSAFCKKK